MDLGPKSLKQWICREWVGKTGLKWVGWPIEWVAMTRTKRQNDSTKENRPWHSPRRSVLIYSLQVRLQSWFLSAIVFLLWFSDPSSMVGFFYYIVPFKRSWSSTCWPSKSLLECLSHQTPLQAPLCIGAANITLFKGFLHINAARKLAAELLMLW